MIALKSIIKFEFMSEIVNECHYFVHFIQGTMLTYYASMFFEVWSVTIYLGNKTLEVVSRNNISLFCKPVGKNAPKASIFHIIFTNTHLNHTRSSDGQNFRLIAISSLNVVYQWIIVLTESLIKIRVLF